MHMYMYMYMWYNQLFSGTHVIVHVCTLHTDHSGSGPVSTLLSTCGL